MNRYIAAICGWWLFAMPMLAFADSTVFTDSKALVDTKVLVDTKALVDTKVPVNAKILRVAIGSDNPPLAYAPDGKPAGLEADFVRLLQVELGAQLQLRVLPTAEAIVALERGEVDMAMAGLAITPELEKRVEFSRPYLHSGEMAIIRTDDIMRFRGAAALLQEGIKVGAVTGTIGADYVKATMNHPVVTTCVSADECLQALLVAQIDVFVGSPAISWRLATESKYGALMSFYRPLNEEYFAWAVAKNNVQLRDRLDAALGRIRQMQMFEHILNRWIPVRVSNN